MSDATRVEIMLSLISHTNVGKTTLARTLLRRDVGDVRDRPHVTDASEAFVLIETGAARLMLWDTPGFGHLEPLMRRLRSRENPIGWLLHHVWDRIADRSLFCSQQAARNVREHADVVLYLVNASEDPEHAGYVRPELELLSWMERPVLLLLNQVGDADERRLVPRWRELADRHEVIRDVLPLDAFARFWVHESTMLERTIPLLDDGKREAMSKLVDAWDARNLRTFDEAVRSISTYLAETAVDRELDSGNVLQELLRSNVARIGLATPPGNRSMRAMSTRLGERTDRVSDTLIELHGLERDHVAEIKHDLDDLHRRGLLRRDGAGPALGAVLGMLGYGLAADVMSGGLTLGGGMIAGGILGALGGSAISRGLRLVDGGEPSVTWGPEFLDQLTHRTLLRYLLIAHWGRGRGPFTEPDSAARWDTRAERELQRASERLGVCWRDAVRTTCSAAELSDRLQPLIRDMLVRMLLDAYPDAATRLGPAND